MFFPPVSFQTDKQKNNNKEINKELQLATTTFNCSWRLLRATAAGDYYVQLQLATTTFNCSWRLLRATAAGDYYVQLLLVFAPCFSHGVRLFLYEQSHLR
jgi:hypothetical protein